ncbi:MAG TPA: Spy/CpxP family protein refolding chaperone [Thermoanaerobaculia bacterium]|nr:Spy/CpxP family protein refolding chaperone [Thermoanaerobaculia bacterium]
MSHWQSRRRCAEYRAGMGGDAEEPRGRRERWAYAMGGEDDAPFGMGGGRFGVRRPLRFLAYRLGLDDAQVGELAKILDEIKTERAQAAVDHRRALSAFADAISGEAFDEAKAANGADLRLKSAERLRGAVVAALGRLHALLKPEQRERLAYLIRTGTLSF